MVPAARVGLLFVATGLCLSCGGAADRPIGARAMAVALLEQGITEARPEVIRPLIGDDYRQHNPRVPDGPEGLLGFVSAFSRVPRERRVQIRVLRSVHDGEFVATQSEYRR